MVCRCLITLFSTWSDFNWQRETDFFFASNQWIQSSTRKRRADFSRAWRLKVCMKLNGELSNAPSPFPLPRCGGEGKGEGASGFTFLLREALRGKPCVFVMLGLFLFAGCRQQMADQPRYEPLARSTFFDDGRAARPLEEGTVARGDR